jgi:hypothetical protein
MRDRIHMRAVQRAAEIFDGTGALASYLNVPPLLVTAWVQGASEVPASAFLKIVEIIVDSDTRRGGMIPLNLVERFRYSTAANG